MMSFSTYTIFSLTQTKMHKLLSWLVKTCANFLYWDRQLSWRFYVFKQDNYAIFIHQDRQLSRQFYVFQWVMQFLHQDRQVPRWFTFLNKLHNYYWEIVNIFQVPYQKADRNNWRSTINIVHSLFPVCT